MVVARCFPHRVRRLAASAARRGPRRPGRGPRNASLRRTLNASGARHDAFASRPARARSDSEGGRDHRENHRRAQRGERRERRERKRRRAEQAGECGPERSDNDDEAQGKNTGTNEQRTEKNRSGGKQERRKIKSEMGGKTREGKTTATTARRKNDSHNGDTPAIHWSDWSDWSHPRQPSTTAIDDSHRRPSIHSAHPIHSYPLNSLNRLKPLKLFHPFHPSKPSHPFHPLNRLNPLHHSIYPPPLCFSLRRSPRTNGIPSSQHLIFSRRSSPCTGSSPYPHTHRLMYARRVALRSPLRRLTTLPHAAPSLVFNRAGGVEPGVEIKDLAQIRAGLDARYDQRYRQPSRQWIQENIPSAAASLHRLLDDGPAALSRREKDHIVSSLSATVYDKDSHTFYMQISALQATPLAMGDLVLLRSNPNQLSMCVEVPTDASDPRFSFATIDGNLQFATRSMVLLRIPSFYTRSASHLIQPENTALGSARIGTVKNSPDHTFVLPILARRLHTSYIPFEVTKAAWDQMPAVTRKLELLHRFLQRSSGPWQVSIFTLCELVSHFDLTKARTLPTQQYLDALFSKVGIEDSIHSLGGRHLHPQPPTRVDAACFVATFWALLQQQEYNLWGKIHTHSALLTPISVTVLPLQSQHLYYEKTLQALKKDNYRSLDEFAHLVNTHNYQPIPTRFPEIVQLLQDYAADNFHNNGAIVTITSKIFRRLTEYQDEDVTSDLCHDLLKKLIPETIPNPLLLNKDLALATSSERTCLEQKVFDLSTPNHIDDAEMRKDFGNLNVYCIDSDTAHEIDDGISIEHQGGNLYTLHVHIADPAALFQKITDDTARDDVLDIALERAFTTYLPDIVQPMLPTTFCRAADMGNDGMKTKTMSFSVNVECKKSGVRILDHTFDVKLGLVSRFPKVTYSKVDQILSDTSNSTQEKKELQQLHKIAKGLRQKRIREQNAIIFGEGFNKGLVKLNPDNDGELTCVSFEDQAETSSTILVSEMMILANTLTGRFFKTNGIPGIYRSYKELTLKDTALQAYSSIREKTKLGEFPTIKDINKTSSFLNSSFYTGTPTRHEMIGAPEYLTVTSPLRRFADMVNHFQLHRYLRNLPACFTQEEVDGLAWHIQSRDVILRTASRASATYWTLKYLKEEQKKDPLQTYKVMVTSVPQMGTVRCVFPTLNAARGILKLNPKKAASVAIGDEISGCKITRLHCLDGIMELEMP